MINLAIYLSRDAIVKNNFYCLCTQSYQRYTINEANTPS